MAGLILVPNGPGEDKLTSSRSFATMASPQTTNYRKVSNMSENGIKAIPNDLLAELMANSRTRNMYGPYALKFLESDEAAVNPAETWPVEFGGKKATTLMQGFRNAIEKADLSEKVIVKLYQDNVFLLNKDRVTVVLTEAADVKA